MQFSAALRLIENTFLRWAAAALAASQSGPSRSVSGVRVFFRRGGEADKGRASAGSIQLGHKSFFLVFFLLELDSGVVSYPATVFPVPLPLRLQSVRSLAAAATSGK